MPRPPRIQASGATYHVNTNSTFGRTLFAENDDRRWFEHQLDDVVRRTKWSVKSYCLLGTHYHLLATTPEPNIAEGMQRLNGMHAQSYNNRHEQFGGLIRDRYHSNVVESDAHLLATLRYIALNPVRAGLCARPADWRWSSYAALIGWAAPPPFLDVDSVLKLFSPDPKVAQARLREFVESDLSPSVFPMTRV
jgi:putative transposase